MFRKYVSLKLAANVLIVAFSALLVFHLLVLLGVFPSDIIWGGQIGTRSQMIIMEIAALLVTALMILMVAIRVNYLQAPKWQPYVRTAMWVIFVLLVLNTAGNLSSSSSRETLLFTPITIVLAVFAYRLAMRGE